MGFAKAANVSAMRSAKPFRKEKVKRLGKDFGSAVAEHLFSRRIENQDVLFFIHRDNGVHCRIEYACQPGFIFAQALPHLMLFMNVGIGTEPFDQPPLFVMPGSGSGNEPTINPVIAAQAEFRLKVRTAFNCGLPGLPYSVFVIGMNLIEPGVSELSFYRLAGVFDPLMAEEIALPVGLASPDQLRQ